MSQAFNEESVSHSLLNFAKDWFFDMIIGFLRSPRWKVPVMSFLDEKCVSFDNEEENKLEFTGIHNVSFLLSIPVAGVQNYCREST
jgi:hypothetical protein